MTVLEHSPETIAGVRDSVVTRFSSRVPLAAREVAVHLRGRLGTGGALVPRARSRARPAAGAGRHIRLKEATAYLREISASHERIVTGVVDPIRPLVAARLRHHLGR